ncbi:SDR family NAD(P)-dependent oxidoreductase [Jongsikchunia kroppenstedtii]|uniref:SDR family NAD(P)-dependent oxidoreductase n=1 Tax=Jongsikchunia kroppenstedtii TaxID=1121721 RepID=UPI0003705D8D|nr:SDR family NAD(P)-dependent oxidoreductase [Jongsikchunia kroppenstedtii]
MTGHRAAAVVDDVLDRTIAPGYSSLGFAFRSRLWPDDDPPPDALVGATTVVTGANSGIGKAIAGSLAQLGATVVMAVRDEERGESARRELLAGQPDADLVVERCDVSGRAEVRDFVARIAARTPRIDAIVHNAGVMPPTRSQTRDGHELTLATHVLGPILMTELARPLLAAATSSRVVFMSSGGMYTQPLPRADPEYRLGRYRAATAYARTKRIQVALTPVLGERWSEDGCVVATMHPGWADTPGLAQSLPRFRTMTRAFLRNADQAADTAVWLTATSPPPPSGLFWHDRRSRPTHYRQATRFTEAQRDEVWRYCASAIGVTP